MSTSIYTTQSAPETIEQDFHYALDPMDDESEQDTLLTQPTTETSSLRLDGHSGDSTLHTLSTFPLPRNNNTHKVACTRSSIVAIVVSYVALAAVMALMVSFIQMPLLDATVDAQRQARLVTEGVSGLCEAVNGALASGTVRVLPPLGAPTVGELCKRLVK